MAEDRHAQPGRGAAVVGVRVAEHDPVEAAERAGRGRQAGDHRLDPGLEHRHAALRILDQVDVHRLHREAAAHEPDALGDPLRIAAQRAPLELRLAVEGARHALLGGRARRRQHADLARERGAVGVGVLAHDLAVAQVEDVEPNEVEPREGRLDALERRRACERALARPVDGDLIAVGDDVLDLEAEVGHGAEELGPVGAHAVGPVRLDVADACAGCRRAPRRRRSRRGPARPAPRSRRS